MKKSGAPESGDLVRLKQEERHPHYTDWSSYQGIYLIIGERGTEVQLLGNPGFEPPMWIRRDHLDIVSSA